MLFSVLSDAQESYSFWRNSKPGHSCWQRFLGVVRRMILKSSLRKFHSFGNCFPGNAATPLGRDCVPRHSLGNLFEHLRHHDPRAQECRLSMTDSWISDHIAPQEFFLFFLHVPLTPLLVSAHIQGPKPDP